MTSRFVSRYVFFFLRCYPSNSEAIFQRHCKVNPNCGTLSLVQINVGLKLLDQRQVGLRHVVGRTRLLWGFSSTLGSCMRIAFCFCNVVVVFCGEQKPHTNQTNYQCPWLFKSWSFFFPYYYLSNLCDSKNKFDIFSLNVHCISLYSLPTKFGTEGTGTNGGVDGKVRDRKKNERKENVL